MLGRSPKVLDKSFENYDYNTRELEWKIDVNYDFMKLDDVVLEDTISEPPATLKIRVDTQGDSCVSSTGVPFKLEFKLLQLIPSVLST